MNDQVFNILSKFATLIPQSQAENNVVSDQVFLAVWNYGLRKVLEGPVVVGVVNAVDVVFDQSLTKDAHNVLYSMYASLLNEAEPNDMIVKDIVRNACEKNEQVYNVLIACCCKGLFYDLLGCRCNSLEYKQGMCDIVSVLVQFYNEYLAFYIFQHLMNNVLLYYNNESIFFREYYEKIMLHFQSNRPGYHRKLEELNVVIIIHKFFTLCFTRTFTKEEVHWFLLRLLKEKDFIVVFMIQLLKELESSLMLLSSTEELLMFMKKIDIHYASVANKC